MKYFLYLMLLMTACCGCAVLSNTEGMMMLADYAKEQEAIRKDIDRKDALFDEFVIRIQNQESFKGRPQDWFIREFDRPLLVKEETFNGMKQKVWLYRYSLVMQGRFKIYVFFSEQGIAERVLLMSLKE